MSNPAPTLNQINAFNATQGTTIDFNIIGGTEVIRSNKIYIYDLSDNSLICTHLYVSTESIHELPPNTSSSIVYASGKSSADFTNNTQYYAQIQTFTDVGGTQGGSGLSIAKLFWCLPTPTLTLSTIPTTISTTSYNVSATYTPNTSGSATNEIQEFQFNLYSAIGALLQTSGVVLYGEGVDLSYNFSGLEVDSTYYVTLDVTTTQGMNVSAQSNTFTVSIDTPTMGSASVVNNGCDGYISVTSNLSSEYEHEESSEVGEIMSFTTDSVNDITELDVDFSPVQDGTPWMSAQDTEPYMFRAVPTQTEDFGHEVDTLVGGTVVRNQLVQNGNFAESSGWNTSYGSISYGTNEGIYTVTTVGQGTQNRIAPTAKQNIINGHKYLVLLDAKLPYSANVLLQAYSTDEGATTIEVSTIGAPTANTYTALSSIKQATASGVSEIRIGIGTYTGKAVDDEYRFKNIQLVDLTAYFGSATIADYVYTLEQEQAGASVAWLRENEPQIFEYHAYDSGSLVSVSGLQSHEMVGKNQFDENSTPTYGQYVNSTYTDNPNRMMTDYIEILPNTDYMAQVDVGRTASLVFINYNYFDANKNWLGNRATNNDTSLVGVKTKSINISDSRAKYLRLVVTSDPDGSALTGRTFANAKLQLEFGSTATAYEAYTKHTYPLDDSITLRGVLKLVDGKLVYDGDEYHSNGGVDRKYGIVDLGTLSWGYSDTYAFFYSTLSGQSLTYSTPSYICAKYAYGGWNSNNADMQNATDKTIWKRFGNGLSQPPNAVYVKDSAYTDAASFKTAMSGVYLVYELATPTTETADPYTNPQIVDPHGTEQYVGSPIPVGHKTTYQRICPISGWDSVEVDVSGVNLFDIDAVGDVHIDANETMRNGFAIKKTGTFTVKAQTHTSNSYIYWRKRNADGTWEAQTGQYITTNSSQYTITKTLQDGDELIIYDASSANTLAVSKQIMTACEIQIELGSTATTYQPYQGTTYTSTFPKYKQQVSQDKTPYITKNIGDTYADTLTENLVGGTIAWNQSVPDTTTTHTISGSIASMDDAVAGNFESVVCDIEPVQDLHGYDKPWVGGAGKNLWSDKWSEYSRPTDYRICPIKLVQGEKYTVKITQVGQTLTGMTVGIAKSGSKYADFIQPSPWAFLNSSGQTIGNAVTYTIDATWTDPKLIIFASDEAAFNSFFENYHIQIEKGETATSWTPYENLCPITGWTGCEVSQAGVNLFGGTHGTGNKYKLFIPQGTEFTVSCNNGTGATYIYFYDKNQTQIDYFSLTQTTADRMYRTFTRAHDIYYFAFGNYDHGDEQIALGTETTYHAYNGTTYPVSWQTEAGTVYGGKLHIAIVDGELKTWVTATNGYIDLGTPTWSYNSGYGVFWCTISDKKNNAPNSGLCSKYPLVNGNATSLVNADAQLTSDKTAILSKDTSTPYIFVRDSSYIDATAIKTAMNGVQLVYELATPQTYQLDPVQVACLLGRNNVWNNISDTTVTYPTNHSYQSLSTTHKYYKRINGVESISVGSDVVVDVGTDNIIDLTQMFGTTIADYIYNTEQSSSSGMGVKFFKSLFPNDDYDYNSGELISVNASAHVIKDANGNVVHTYPLDSDLVLRGIPKLDANNKLYYDGDVYEADGSVTRKYGIVDLGTLTWTVYTVEGKPPRFRGVIQSGSLTPASINWVCTKPYNHDTNPVFTMVNDKACCLFQNYVYITDSDYSDAATFKASLSGVYMVYELATHTTETADPFEENQAIVSNGIEEYIVTEQGDVEMPVGHDSTYYATEVYGGTIDMAKGVLTINCVVCNMGTLTWTYNNTYNAFFASISTTSWFSGINLWSSSYDFLGTVSDSAMSTAVNGTFGCGSYNGLQLKVKNTAYTNANDFKSAMNGVQLVYELATPIEISLTPQQMQTLSGQNNIWSNTNGGMYLVYQLPITSLLVKRRDVADVSGKWLTLYSTPITQASDMDFTFIDFLNQYGKTYQYALVPVLAQDQSGVIVQIEGGYTVSDNVDSIFDGVYIADQTNVERVKAGVGYGNIDMNQGVGSITPIGSKYPIVITNSQNQYHNGSVRGTIVPNDFYSNGNLSRIDMVNKRDELEQFLTNKCAKIIKDWNGKMWLVMIMSNVACSFDDNYGMGMVSFSADWLEVGDPTNQQDLYNAGLINVGGV